MMCRKKSLLMRFSRCVCKCVSVHVVVYLEYGDLIYLGLYGIKTIAVNFLLSFSCGFVRGGS